MNTERGKRNQRIAFTYLGGREKERLALMTHSPNAATAWTGSRPKLEARISIQALQASVKNQFLGPSLLPPIVHNGKGLRPELGTSPGRLTWWAQAFYTPAKWLPPRPEYLKERPPNFLCWGRGVVEQIGMLEEKYDSCSLHCVQTWGSNMSRYQDATWELAGYPALRNRRC